MEEVARVLHAIAAHQLSCWDGYASLEGGRGQRKRQAYSGRCRREGLRDLECPLQLC